jgi:electron transfer flavoprotein beta subunit
VSNKVLARKAETVRLAVLIKQVPDTDGDRAFDLETGLLDRARSHAVLDEIDERALEFALRLKDVDRSIEVVAIALGPTRATEALRTALAMGADRGVHLVSDALVGADAPTTGAVLATTVATLDADLVVLGAQSTDGSTGLLPGIIAARLDLPLVGPIVDGSVASGSVRATVSDDDGESSVTADLPAIVSVGERFPEGRLPGFRGTMAAKKKPIDTRSPDEVPAPTSIVISVEAAPPRSAGTVIADGPDAVPQLVDFLAGRRLI